MEDQKGIDSQTRSIDGIPDNDQPKRENQMMTCGKKKKRGNELHFETFRFFIAHVLEHFRLLISLLALTRRCNVIRCMWHAL